MDIAVMRVALFATITELPLCPQRFSWDSQGLQKALGKKIVVIAGINMGRHPLGKLSCFLMVTALAFLSNMDGFLVLDLFED